MPPGEGKEKGRGTSRAAVKWPTLVMCSFSMRKKFQMKRRKTSPRAIKKEVAAECCLWPGKTT